MTIYEGQQIPAGYGIVRVRYDVRGYEALPMPFHWLKRFYYWLLKYDLTENDKRVLQIQKDTWAAAYKAGQQQRDNQLLNSLEEVISEKYDFVWGKITDAQIENLRTRRAEYEAQGRLGAEDNN